MGINDRRVRYNLNHPLVTNSHSIHFQTKQEFH